MKKTYYVILTLLLMFVLAACGQGEAGKKSGEEEPQQNVEVEPENNEEQDETNEETEPIESEPEKLDKLTLYFSDNDLMNIYRVEINEQPTLDEDGLRKAVQLWLDRPNYEGLANLVPEGVLLQSVELLDDTAYLSFSPELLTANLGSTGEAMLIEQVTMIVEQFGYNKLFILVDGEVSSLLGHVYLSETEPIIVENSPEDYLLY